MPATERDDDARHRGDAQDLHIRELHAKAEKYERLGLRKSAERARVAADEARKAARK